MNENVWIPIKISLKFVPKGPINNIPALVQIMACRLDGAKPLSEPMMVSLPTHICVTRPRWVNDETSSPTKSRTESHHENEHNIYAGAGDVRPYTDIKRQVAWRSLCVIKYKIDTYQTQLGIQKIIVLTNTHCPSNIIMSFNGVMSSCKTMYFLMTVPTHVLLYHICSHWYNKGIKYWNSNLHICIVAFISYYVGCKLSIANVTEGTNEIQVCNRHITQDLYYACNAV